MNFEQPLQIIAIITFLSSAIYFFVKVGEYKSVINTNLKVLEDDVSESKKDIKTLKEEVENIKSDHNQVTTRLETLLIEVKTKLELFMQLTGFLDKHEKPKN